MKHRPSRLTRLISITALPLTLWVLSCASMDVGGAETENPDGSIDAECVAAEPRDWHEDDTLFETGEENRRVEKDYEGAIAQYARIEKPSPFYERALVNIGVCKFRLGEQSEALAIFTGYLDEYAIDEPGLWRLHSMVEARRQARAVASFFRALIEFGMGDYESVIDHARNYNIEFPAQLAMAPWVMRMVGVSLARTGRIDEARSYLEIARERYPENAHINALAKELEDL